MKRWLMKEFKVYEDYKFFFENIGKYQSLYKDLNNYYKIFEFKEKKLKGRFYFIADEGNELVKFLETKFGFEVCVPPERKLITRVGGWPADRDWMKGIPK